MRNILLTVAISAAIGLTGCAKEVRLPTSADLPAAMGEAKVSKDNNGNTRVKLKVEHFAPPQRLQPPKSIYVVWVETPNHEMYNLGQLKIDDDLKGKIEGITPFKVFQLVITAEDYPTVTTPGQVVITTRAIETND